MLVRELITSRRLRLTSVTAFEIRVGSDFLDHKDSILRLFRSSTLPLDPASGLTAGRIHARLSEEGPIGLADTLQVGIYLCHHLPLATRNRKHFERVPELEIIDLEPL